MGHEIKKSNGTEKKKRLVIKILKVKQHPKEFPISICTRIPWPLVTATNSTAIATLATTF